MQNINQIDTAKQQAKAALAMLVSVTETVRAAGSNGVPQGTLYAMLMDRMSQETFNSMIRILLNSGLVKSENYLLVWKGPLIA